MAAQQELQAVPQDDELDLQSRSLTCLPALPAALRVLNLTRNRITDLAQVGCRSAYQVGSHRAELLKQGKAWRRRRGLHRYIGFPFGEPI